MPPPTRRTIPVVISVEEDAVTTLHLEVCEECCALTHPDDSQKHLARHAADNGPRKPPKPSTPQPVPPRT
jgi:hypothetical protein